MQNQYLDYLINPIFQGVNRLSALSFENNTDKKSDKRFLLPTVEIKKIIMLWFMGQIFLINLLKIILQTLENILKIAICQGDEYTTGCLLDYSYFKKGSGLIAIDLSKQQVLNADPKDTTWMVLILENVKEKIFDFSQGTLRVLETLQEICFGWT